jgi:hypothetical protein
VATVRDCAAFALGIHPGTAEYEESGEEPEEDAEDDSKVPNKKTKVTSNGDEAPDQDESWKEGDDDEDVEEDDDVDGDEEVDVESAPRTVTKWEKIPQKVVASVVASAAGSSLKRSKELQQRLPVKRVKSAAAKKRVAASASAPFTSGTSRIPKAAWQNIFGHTGPAS